MLGIGLVDTDVFNVPLLVTDPYGHLHPRRRTASRMAMLADGGHGRGQPGRADRQPAALARTGHAFLDDIAHSAVPGRA